MGLLLLLHMADWAHLHWEAEGQVQQLTHQPSFSHSLFGGDILMSLLFFYPPRPSSSFLACIESLLTLYEQPVFFSFLHEKSARVSFHCAGWKPEMYSNLDTFTTNKLCWIPGSSCRFIRGQLSSGKTAPLSAACLLGWQNSRRHKRCNIIKTKAQISGKCQFCFLHFQVNSVSLSLHWIEANLKIHDLPHQLVGHSHVVISAFCQSHADMVKWLQFKYLVVATHVGSVFLLCSPPHFDSGS